VAGLSHTLNTYGLLENALLCKQLTASLIKFPVLKKKKLGEKLSFSGYPGMDGSEAAAPAVASAAVHQLLKVRVISEPGRVAVELSNESAGMFCVPVVVAALRSDPCSPCAALHAALAQFSEEQCKSPYAGGVPTAQDRSVGTTVAWAPAIISVSCAGRAIPCAPEPLCKYVQGWDALVAIPVIEVQMEIVRTVTAAPPAVARARPAQRHRADQGPPHARPRSSLCAVL
jgi:hypothetical protein